MPARNAYASNPLPKTRIVRSLFSERTHIRHHANGLAKTALIGQRLCGRRGRPASMPHRSPESWSPEVRRNRTAQRQSQSGTRAQA
jgi:hypothetical protein